MYSSVSWTGSGGGVWLGLTNMRNATFNNASDAEANLEYFDGTPYKHIHGITSYTFDNNSPCLRMWPDGASMNDRNFCDNVAGLICEYNLANPANGNKRRKRQSAQGESRFRNILIPYESL